MDAVLGLLSQQKGDEVNSLFNQLTNSPQTPASLNIFIQAAIAILSGSRDLALADNPELDYDDAAEILFLISRLGKK